MNKQALKMMLINGYVMFCRLFYHSKNANVLFSSFSGKTYSDNPKAISEKLYKVDNSIKISWILSSKRVHDCPNYVKVIDSENLLKKLHAIATANVFVSNESFIYIKKGKQQHFIQTWHGDRGFKKILLDSPFSKREFEAEGIDGYCDMMVAGSAFCEKFYKSAFGYNGTILKVGSPRNDILIHNDETGKKLIRQRLNISENKKVILYAPTLRRKNVKEKSVQSIQDLDIGCLIRFLNNSTNEKWVCLERAHPDITRLDVETSDDIIDVTSYEDMVDLLRITDVLITDYSSSAGDFALTGNPIILYQPDRDKYLKYDRSFYFDLDQSPYMIAKSKAEIETLIGKLDWNESKDRDKRILDFYGAYETGNASQQVVNQIIEWLSINKRKGEAK